MTRSLLVGLTGGIAAGKSTVARMFEALGAALIDADHVSRDVMAPGGLAYDPVVKAFGRDILGPSGEIDRTKLGALVFDDPEKRKALESITHPAIAFAAMQKAAAFRQAGAPVIIYEAALLVETGSAKAMDKLVVVRADDEVRIARMHARDGLDRAAALKRLAAQAPQAQKEAVADFVIDNSGTLADAQRQVEDVWRQLTGESGAGG